MKFEKKAVIFDLDGVICFTDKLSGVGGSGRPLRNLF